MTITNIIKRYIWRVMEDLKSITKELKECQITKSVNSCLKCNEILKCQLRNNYVLLVYNSMGLGSNGGFKF